MNEGIFLSIKPKFLRLIETGEKNYEYRKYIPQKKFNYIYVYESSPTCMLKYVIYIDKIIEYPNKVIERGYGNADFNNGMKESKFAYHILHIDKLINPIPLNELKKTYNFLPPQSFIYAKTNIKLKKYIDNLDKIRIF